MCGGGAGPGSAIVTNSSRHRDEEFAATLGTLPVRRPLAAANLLVVVNCLTKCSVSN